MAMTICAIVLFGLFIYVTCLSDVYIQTDPTKPPVKMTKYEAIKWRQDHSQSLTEQLNDPNNWYPKQP